MKMKLTRKDIVYSAACQRLLENIKKCSFFVLSYFADELHRLCFLLNKNVSLNILPNISYFTMNRSN